MSQSCIVGLDNQLVILKMCEMWPYYKSTILQNIDTPAINKLHLTHLFLAKTENVSTHPLCQGLIRFCHEGGYRRENQPYKCDINLT